MQNKRTYYIKPTHHHHQLLNNPYTSVGAIFGYVGVKSLVKWRHSYICTVKVSFVWFFPMHGGLFPSKHVFIIKWMENNDGWGWERERTSLIKIGLNLPIWSFDISLPIKKVFNYCIFYLLIAVGPQLVGWRALVEEIYIFFFNYLIFYESYSL